jgi:uncharacterized protein YjiS (DUF1127 family)
VQIMSNRIAASIVIADANSRPFGRQLAALGIRLQAARARYAASRELAAMSAGELADMGITRHDVNRLFDPHLAPEFQSRGRSSVRVLPVRTSRAGSRHGARAAAPAACRDTAGMPATINMMPQGSAVIASLES